MNPLELHLSGRSTTGTRIRVALSDAAGALPGSLAEWTERRIWNFRASHMRRIGQGLHFRLQEGGGWILEKHGSQLARSVPLSAVAGRIGKPVSIVATGPSARDHDFDGILRGERFVVAVNGAPTFLKGLGIVPDLYVVTDPGFAASSQAHFANAPGVPLVTTHRAASRLATGCPRELAGRVFSLIERVNGWYGLAALPLRKLSDMNEASGSPFTLPGDESLKMKVGWSARPELGFFSGCTVVFAALQVVVGLGARDIEIIGMDLGGKGRVYREDARAQPSLLEEQYGQYILPSFENMHRALKGSETRIDNASTVCPLPDELFSF